MFSPFLAFVLSQSQTVTFSHGCAPCLVVIEDLAKQLGEPMRAEGDVQWEILYVRVKDVPRDQLLAQIAKASGGAWGRDPKGVQVLKRSQVWLKAKSDERYRERLKNIREFVAGIEKGKIGAADYQATLEDRVFAKIIRQVGMETLAGLSEDERVVYSTRPTPMQRPLSMAPDLVASLVDGHNARVRSSDFKPIPYDYESIQDKLPPEFLAELRKAEKEARAEVAISRADRVLAVFSRYSSPQVVQMRVSVVDAQGVAVSVRSTHLTSLILLPPKESNSAAPAEDQTTGGVARMSVDSKRLRSALGPYGYGTIPAELGLRKRFADPVRADPLLKMDSEMLDSWLTAEPANTVVNHPVPFWMWREATPFSALRNHYPVDPRSGWRVADPNGMPVLDRDKLARAIREFADKPQPSLGEKLGWIRLDAKSEGDIFVFDVYRRVFELPTFYEPPGLRMMASLSPSQEAAARKGATFHIRDLSLDQKNLLHEFAFGIAPLMAPIDVQTNLKSIIGMIEYYRRLMLRTNASGSFSGEPTDVLPNGLPGDGVVKFEVESGPGYLREFPGATAKRVLTSDPENPQDLLTSLAMRGSREELGANRPLPKIVEVDRTQITVSILPTKTYGVIDELHDVRSIGPSKSIDQMGDNFAKALAKAKKDAEPLIPYLRGFNELYKLQRSQQKPPPPAAR